MPLTLPNLDDRRWDQLVAEGRSLIPVWAPEWTNHNAADPGITLLELFAYLAELLIFRLNQISDESLQAFLRLIDGTGGEPQHNIRADRQQTLQDYFRLRRAVSRRDFEILSLAVNQGLGGDAERVARVKCIAGSDLIRGREITNPESAGHVSVIVLSDRRAHAGAALLNTVREALESARLLTTHVHVGVPKYVTLAVRLTLECDRHAVAEHVRTKAAESLQRFLDPLEGGTDRHGWPFGRSVYVSEIYDCLGAVPGVNYVTRTVDPSTHSPANELLVSPSDAWRVKRNRLGQLEAIELRPDELVAAWIDEEDITVIDGVTREGSRERRQ